VKPPTQVAAAAANIPPQRGIHCRREVPGPVVIGSANVLVMNEELVQIRKRTDPFKTEEPPRRAAPDARDEPREVLAVSQSGPAAFGEPLEGAGQNEARPANEIAFSQHEMSGEIVSSPALEQGRSRRAEVLEKIAER
jgi:hypothetical protein